MSNIPRSEYWADMVEILDHCFPKKKCKERGSALVMISYIEMLLTGNADLIDILKKLS